MTNGNSEKKNTAPTDSMIADLQSAVTDSVRKDLNLEYERIISFDKAFRILAGWVLLSLGIFFLGRGTTTSEIIFGACCVTGYLRIAFGSIIITQLTKDSAARFQAWLDRRATMTTTLRSNR